MIIYIIGENCYDKKHLNPLRSLIMITHFHTLSNMFQILTGHDNFESYFKKRFIAERNCHYGCDYLKKVENNLRICALHPTKRSNSRKVSPELDHKILLNTKRALVKYSFSKTSQRIVFTDGLIKKALEVQQMINRQLLSLHQIGMNNIIKHNDIQI